MDDNGGYGDILLLAICKLSPELSDQLFVVDLPKAYDGFAPRRIEQNCMLRDFSLTAHGTALGEKRGVSDPMWELQMLNVEFSNDCPTVKAYRIIQTALLLDPQIRGGLLSYNLRDANGVSDGHSISFTKCNKDYLFRQGGSGAAKQLSKMILMTEIQARAYTGHIETVKAVYVLKRLRGKVVSLSAME
jgi:hypothetical protein